MVRFTKELSLPDNSRYVEACGLSTDTKPTTGIVTGSIFVEVDTGNVFFYNEASSSWVEQFSFQG